MKSGITLIEILIALAVISLLAGLTLVAGTKIHKVGQINLTKTTLALLDGALQEYHDYYNSFPDYNGDLELPRLERNQFVVAALRNLPESRKIISNIDPALIKTMNGAPAIFDPWQNLVDCNCHPSLNFPHIISLGPDGIFKTPDDIHN